MSDAVAKVFRTVFDLDTGFQLEDAMSFSDVPGWDSVGHMNLVNELESELGVSLDMDEIISLESVLAVREIVRTKAA